MSQQQLEPHPNAVLVAIVTKDQHEHLQDLVKRGKFRDESSAVRKALDMLFAAA
ncbi:MAG: hypothetical protein QMC89_06465 [Candidatus Hodarchaeaceae archaeon]|nr:hypothetical protein [Candidatus Hodarchaeaceae archaeon]